MRPLNLWALAALSLALAGCAGPHAVHLYNPETKATVACDVDPWTSWTPGADNERCAKGYEKLGFKRVD